MGSKKVYMSEIMESLNDQLALMVTSLSSVVANLQVVNASVSQNLETLSVDSGMTHSYQAIAAASVSAVGNATDGGVKTTIGKLKMLCNGSVNIQGYLGTDAPIFRGGIWMKRNSDAWVKLMSTVAPLGEWAASDADITVGFGDVLEFAVGGYENGKTISSVNGIVVRYNILNIAESGAFAEA